MLGWHAFLPTTDEEYRLTVRWGAAEGCSDVDAWLHPGTGKAKQEHAAAVRVLGRMGADGCVCVCRSADVKKRTVLFSTVRCV